MARNLKTGYTKRSIPSSTRVALAVQHGVNPGESRPAKCSYCEFVGSITWSLRRDGKPSTWVHFQYLEMDHVIPEFSGGGGDIDNIVLACRPCNRSKGHRFDGKR